MSGLESIKRLAERLASAPERGGPRSEGEIGKPLTRLPRPQSSNLNETLSLAR